MQWSFHAKILNYKNPLYPWFSYQSTYLHYPSYQFLLRLLVQNQISSNQPHPTSTDQFNLFLLSWHPFTNQHCILNRKLKIVDIYLILLMIYNIATPCLNWQLKWPRLSFAAAYWTTSINTPYLNPIDGQSGVAQFSPSLFQSSVNYF